MQFPQRVQAGQPITAEAWNQLIDVLNAFLRMSVASPLQLSKSDNGWALSLAPHFGVETCELTASLSKGGEANAAILKYDGHSWVKAPNRAIKVMDAIGSFTGSSGDRGYCFFHNQSGKYLLIQLEC